VDEGAVDAQAGTTIPTVIPAAVEGTVEDMAVGAEVRGGKLSLVPVNLPGQYPSRFSVDCFLASLRVFTTLRLFVRRVGVSL
jgi:hypothetical protein